MEIDPRTAGDGRALATISSGSNLQVWRTADFHCLGEMPMPFARRKAWSNNQWNQVSVAPGGTHLAIANGIENGVGDEGVRLELYEIPSLREARDLEGLRTWAASLAFSRDGTQLAAGGFFGENQALVWEVSSGRLLHALTNVPGRSGLLRFSPRKTWLAVRLDEGFSWGLQVGLWRLPNPDREQVLGKRRHRVLDMAFSPDERCLATAGDDATLSLWDVATGNRLKDLMGQLTYFTAVAWSRSVWIAFAFGPPHRRENPGSKPWFCRAFPHGCSLLLYREIKIG
jgi:WD40 repeat protein